MWMVPKARYLFDTAVKAAADPEHGGLAYSFDLEGGHEDVRLQASGHWDKIFWVQVRLGLFALDNLECILLFQNEALGTAAMLAVETGEEGYWRWYDSQWEYAWQHFVDHRLTVTCH